MHKRAYLLIILYHSSHPLISIARNSEIIRKLKDIAMHNENFI